MKNLTLKALAFASVMLIGLGASAQVEGTDYVAYDVAAVAPANIDYVTLRTGGTTTMGYYAKPDANYHTNYTAGGGWTITPGFVWNWSVVPAMTISKPGALNYVEIAFTATGNYAVNVAEQAPASMGGCVDATPVVMNVTVVLPPTATITTADALAFCDAQAAQSITLSFGENVPVGVAAYAFAVTETIENLDGAGIATAVSSNATFVDFPTTGKLKSPALLGAASPYTYAFNSSALAIVGGKRTRYTYDLVKATDAPALAAQGVISAISQKSDYVAHAGGTDYLTYAFTDSQVVFIVNPTPVTGPIYHIANTFAY